MTPIYKVSNTLVFELRKLWTEEEMDPNSITIESPGTIDPIPQKGLSLFLYHIAENQFFKNQSYSQEFYSNPLMLRKPPLALDLYYILIPFGDAKTRQTTLSKVLQYFYDNPVIDLLDYPSETPDPSSELTTVRNNEIKIVPLYLTTEQLQSLWNMFSNIPYGISICYMITPVLIPSNTIIPSSRVLTKDTAYYSYQKDDIE